YAVKANNSDEATLKVIDVDSLQDLPGEVIEGAKYASASWTPDGGGFYYTWLPTDPAIPASERPGYQEVRFHKLGEPPARDRVVRPALRDATRFISVDISKDGRWLVEHVASWSSNDIYLRDAQR